MDVEEAGLEEVWGCLQSSYSLQLLNSYSMLQRLKSALWLSIGKIVDEETVKLGANATPQFIGALTEMVWAQIGMCLTVVLCCFYSFSVSICGLFLFVGVFIKNVYSDGN